jgi:hypothetical protein
MCSNVSTTISNEHTVVHKTLIRSTTHFQNGVRRRFAVHTTRAAVQNVCSEANVVSISSNVRKGNRNNTVPATSSLA